MTRTETQRTSTDTAHDGRWIPLVDWPYRWPTVGALRQRLHLAKRSGLGLPWAKRWNGRVLVNPAQFFAAIDESDCSGHSV